MGKIALVHSDQKRQPAYLAGCLLIYLTLARFTLGLRMSHLPGELRCP
ncbi:hypothetical protein EHLJMEHL_01294 [Vreelandella titanicae]|jgi:hypothetical protein